MIMLTGIELLQKVHDVQKEVKCLKIGDIAFVESEIAKNREYSAANREEVLEYGKTFEWSNVVSKYYVPAMKQIIERYQ